MAIVLYHHPFSRAANTVWMLEEVGVEYELKEVGRLVAAGSRVAGRAPGLAQAWRVMQE